VVDPTEPLDDGGYRLSSVNATMFARTGGDGVHFSLLSSGAVVMTVPMAFEAPNHVIGADIREFLALVCRLRYSPGDARIALKTTFGKTHRFPDGFSICPRVRNFIPRSDRDLNNSSAIHNGLAFYALATGPRWLIFKP
jgi:hypothetical protein